MQELIRRSLMNALSLFITSLILPGLAIQGGPVSFMYAGALLAILTTILDPIIKFLTIPFNILTFGLLSFFSTLSALVVLILLYHNVTVTNFTLQELSFGGIKTGEIYVSGALSYVAISATIYALNKIIDTIFTK